MKVNLVIQTAFLGDLILTVPFLKRLKKINPDQSLWIVCKKGLGQFLKDLKIVDDFIEVEKSNSESYEIALSKAAQVEVSQLWLIHRSFRSLMWARKVKAQYKIGYSSFLGRFFLDKYVRYEKTWPDVLRKFSLLNDSETVQQLNKIEKKDFLNFVDDQGRLVDPPEDFSFEKPEVFKNLEIKKQVCLFPGSVWATKKWHESGFESVGQWFNQNNYKVLLLGSKDEHEICKRISQKISNSEVLAGQLSLTETLKVVAESSMVIANDSAATHMASWMATPVVTIFGPTIPEFGFRPWLSQSRIVQIKNLNCRPCGAHGPMKCPKGHHKCMNDIHPEKVIQGVVDLKIL